VISLTASTLFCVAWRPNYRARIAAISLIITIGIVARLPALAGMEDLVPSAQMDSASESILVLLAFLIIVIAPVITITQRR
jgi:preprotein translocase subunit SecY